MSCGIRSSSWLRENSGSHFNKKSNELFTSMRTMHLARVFEGRISAYNVTLKQRVTLWITRFMFMFKVKKNTTIALLGEFSTCREIALKTERHLWCRTRQDHGGFTKILQFKSLILLLLLSIFKVKMLLAEFVIFAFVQKWHLRLSNTSDTEPDKTTKDQDPYEVGCKRTENTKVECEHGTHD